MHDGMPYGLNQGQGQGHSKEVDRQSPTELIFLYLSFVPGSTQYISYSYGTIQHVCAESAVKHQSINLPTCCMLQLWTSHCRHR